MKNQRSIVYGNLKEIQRLINEKAGTGEFINEQRERVDFGKKIIGKYYDRDRKEFFETTWGIIHYGKNGTQAHIVIVPSNPMVKKN